MKGFHLERVREARLFTEIERQSKIPSPITPPLEVTDPAEWKADAGYPSVMHLLRAERIIRDLQDTVQIFKGENELLREGSRHCNEEHGSSLDEALKARAKVAELEENKLDDIERTEMQAATIARQKNDFNLLIDLSNSRLKEIQEQAAVIKRQRDAIANIKVCSLDTDYSDSEALAHITILADAALTDGAR